MFKEIVRRKWTKVKSENVKIFHRNSYKKIISVSMDFFTTFYLFTFIYFSSIESLITFQFVDDPLLESKNISSVFPAFRENETTTKVRCKFILRFIVNLNFTSMRKLHPIVIIRKYVRFMCGCTEKMNKNENGKMIKKSVETLIHFL